MWDWLVRLVSILVTSSATLPVEMAEREEVVTQMEFAVQMSCKSCEDEVRSALNVPGVSSVFVDVANELVLVKSTLPSATVQQRLKDTGKLVVFRGYGGGGSSTSTTSPSHHGAAVSIMKWKGQVRGLARLVQVSQDQCVVEGTVDGLEPSAQHSLAVHQYGDMSNNCESCGDIFAGASSSSSQHAGDLGVVEANEKGRASFHFVSDRLKVWDIIGRGMVVHNRAGVTPSGIMCGVIARSAGLFENTKKVCTCDGVTIWDEAKKNASE